MTANTTTSAANAGSANHKRPDNYNTSTTSQQLRILDWLLIHNIINTFEARDVLDVAHPAGRIRELRAKGHNIITTMIYVYNGKARHKIGQYTLLPKVARDD